MMEPENGLERPGGPAATDCGRVRDALSAFLAGELNEAGAGAVRSHVEGCAECGRLMVALQRTAEGVDTLPDAVPPVSLSLRVLEEAGRLLAPSLAEAPDIMTPEQLARFLQVPLGKLEDEIESLPGFEVGGELRFRRERVVEWIEECERARERSETYARLRAV